MHHMNHDNILCRFLRTLLVLFQGFFFALGVEEAKRSMKSG
jgi:hypothetical protein